jgi:hypothetical protein
MAINRLASCHRIVPGRRTVSMTATTNRRTSSVPGGKELNWPAGDPEVSALLAAMDRFLANPAEAALADEASRAIGAIALEGPGGVAALQAVRRKRLRRDGGFACRYIAVKWLSADAQVRPLPQPMPARDRIPEQMARIVAEHPARFPQGATGFFEHERPLLQSHTGEFKSVLAVQLGQELKPLTAGVRAVSHAQLASLLDLAAAYRHQAQVRQAHVAALEKIDAGDVRAMCEFLATLAGRLPLSSAEFERFLELARTEWASASPQDILLRGRVVTLGLEGKTHVLQSWVTPMTRELAVRGALPRLIQQYASERRPLAPQAPVRPRAALVSHESVLEHDTQELAASDTGIHIFEGTPEPERMHVLRNYVRCATVCAVVTLDEALRIAQARPDVPGHRQHVIRLFHDEGWIMSPRRHGEPVFEKRAAPSAQASPGTPPIPAAPTRV